MIVSSESNLMSYLDNVKKTINHIINQSHGRPTYLGEIASGIGRSLEHTLEFLTMMENIRPATIEEKNRYDAPCPDEAMMFVFV